MHAIQSLLKLHIYIYLHITITPYILHTDGSFESAFFVFLIAIIILEKQWIIYYVIRTAAINQAETVPSCMVSSITRNDRTAILARLDAPLCIFLTEPDFTNLGAADAFPTVKFSKP